MNTPLTITQQQFVIDEMKRELTKTSPQHDFNRLLEDYTYDQLFVEKILGLSSYVEATTTTTTTTSAGVFRRRDLASTDSDPRSSEQKASTRSSSPADDATAKPK